MNRSSTIVSEAELVEAVQLFLAADGYRVRSEVPNMGQSVDLVATRGRWITMIEAKMRDWRRALIQCQAHEVVADFICIAMAACTVSNELAHAAEARGYGVISCNPVDGTCQWALRPARNGNIWLPQRRHIAQAMRKIEYAS